MFHNNIRRKQVVTEDVDTFQPNYSNIIQAKKRNPIEFTSGIIVDSNLLLIPATSMEKKLLEKAGLNVTDANHIIKTRDGKIKGAISFTQDKNKKIISINYIDADTDDRNFKKGIVRLATSPAGISLQQDQISVTRDQIRPDLIQKC